MSIVQPLIEAESHQGTHQGNPLVVSLWRVSLRRMLQMEHHDPLMVVKEAAQNLLVPQPARKS